VNLFENHMLTAILAEALVSVSLLAVGYFVGKYRERRQLRGRDLTDYDFYPYQTTADNFAEFSLRDFRLGMHYTSAKPGLTSGPPAHFYRRTEQRTRAARQQGQRFFPEAILQVPRRRDSQRRERIYGELPQHCAAARKNFSANGN